MAQPAYLWLTLDGNEIEGEPSVTSMDRHSTIECLSFQYGLVQPFDKDSGASSAKQQHRQVTIQKAWDKASPQLLNGLAKGKRAEATFKFYRPQADGTEGHFYTVKLEDAFISSVIQESDTDSSLHELEEVKFVFRRITWVNETHSVEATDTWSGGR